LIEIDVAAAPAGRCESQRTVALIADHAGNFVLQVVGTVVDRATTGCRKDLKTVVPELDLKVQD
jgi:hypothetical protein